MRIGVAAPVDVAVLGDFFPRSTLPSTYSFPWTSLLIREYVALGHEVDVFTCSEEVDEPKVFDDGHGLRLFVGRRRARARQRALDFFAVERRDISRLIRVAQPDVIHAHWLGEFAAAALSERREVLVTAHDSPQVMLRHYHGAYWRLRAAFTYRNLIRTRNLTAVSESLAKELEQLPLAPAVRSVIPNGIPLSGRAIRRLGVRQAGAPVYACVANGFDDRKNTRVALEAFARVRSMYPRSELWMIGTDHGQGESAARYATENGMSEGVRFIGRSSSADVGRFLASEVDVLVHTSRWEAASIAILEAQSEGVPVIGGAGSGGVPDALAHGRCGVLVDVDSADEVAQAMIRLADFNEEYVEISEAAAARFDAEFTMARTAARYVAELEALIVSTPEGNR